MSGPTGYSMRNDFLAPAQEPASGEDGGSGHTPPTVEDLP